MQFARIYYKQGDKIGGIFMIKDHSGYGKPMSRKLSEPEPYTGLRKSTQEQEKRHSSNYLVDLLEPVNIITDQVYSSYQLRSCFPKFTVNMPKHSDLLHFVNITFQEGKLISESLKITPLGAKRPGHSRVQFEIQIPYQLILRDKISDKLLHMNGVLPEIKKDTVMCIPEARNEFNYRIIAETRTELLHFPESEGEKMMIPIGIFMIISVVGRVQLQLPAYRTLQEPLVGEPYEAIELELCQEFEKRIFPEDFFPPAIDDPDLNPLK